MKLPKLIDFFPMNEAMADLYGGWLEGPYFKKIFNKGTNITHIKNANIFLKENGFDTEINLSDFDDDLEIEIDLITFTYKALGKNMLLMIYEQPLMSKPIDSLIELIRLFRDERDWKQFHSPKNLSMAISSEAGELLDLFLWDRDKDVNQQNAANELSDILIYLLLISKELNIDIFDSVINKIIQNDKKYPVKKALGNAKKYNKF